MTNHSKIIGIASALGATLCWGSGTLMSKDILDIFPPTLLLIVQIFASVVLLWIFVIIRVQTHPLRLMPISIREIAAFASLGILEPGMAYLLGLIGLVYVDASDAVIIQASESLMIVFLSIIIYGIIPRMRLIFLLIISFIGLFLALKSPAGSTVSQEVNFGYLLIFLGTAAAALYVVISGKYATRYDPAFIVACQQTVALVFAVLLLPLGLDDFSTIKNIEASWQVWLYAGFSGVVQYALAFSLYMVALRHIGANISGSFLNLIPVFGLTGAVLFLNETLTMLQLIGTGMTIIAVALVNVEHLKTNKPSA
jgi:drug/metabolite transporter (DMT)-like permease